MHLCFISGLTLYMTTDGRLTKQCNDNVITLFRGRFKMNDLEFRRVLYENPYIDHKDIKIAIKEDPRRLIFVKKLLKYEEKITLAMQVPVPEHLFDKILLRQSIENHHRDKKHTIKISIAASVALVTLFSYFLINPYFIYNSESYENESYNNASDYAIAHVNHPESYMQNVNKAQVSPNELNHELISYGGELTNSAVRPYYVKECSFGNIIALHLVYNGNYGDVTMFIVSDQPDLKFNKRFFNKKIKGVSWPINQQYRVILLGSEKEHLDKWRNNIEGSIAWSA